MIEDIFKKYWDGKVKAEFYELSDLKIRWVRYGDVLEVYISDIIRDAPEEVLDELAKRISLKLNGNACMEVVGPCLSRWLSENLSIVRGRLCDTIEPSAIVPVDDDDWEVWFTDAVDKVEVRTVTKLVLAPAYYDSDAPEEVLAWLYDCAKAGKRIKAPSSYFDWLWDMGKI